MEVNLSLIKSNKGKDLLCLNNYTYSCDKTRENTDNNQLFYWKCVNKAKSNCEARARTVKINGIHVLMGETHQHNHLGSVAEVQLKNLGNSLKELAKVSSDPPSIIVQNLTANIPVDFQPYLPKMSAMKQKVRRKRKIENNLPKEPEFLSELEIPREYSVTLKGTEFIKKINVEGGCILLFTTLENLRILSTSDFWIADGTFKTVPKLFTQLYTIHGRIGPNIGDPIIPLVYALMSSKLEIFYRQLFQELIEKATENDIELNPGIIIIDFELGVMNAIKTEFANVRIQGCNFHLGQIIFRKIQELGLVSQYNNDENFSLKLRKLNALAFLPHQEIPAAFAMVKEQLQGEAEDLLKFFEINYVNGRTNNRLRGAPRYIPPTYTPEIWSVYLNNQARLPRTTNKQEAWHKRWNTLLGGKHTGIFQIINEIKKEQNHSEIIINKYENSMDYAENSKKNDKKKEQEFQRIIDSRDEDLDKFLKAIAYRFKF